MKHYVTLCSNEMNIEQKTSTDVCGTQGIESSEQGAGKADDEAGWE